MAALVGALALVAPAQPAPAGREPGGEPGRGPAPRVEYGTANGKRLLLDAYVPTPGSDRRPAVVMFHGGGIALAGLRGDGWVERHLTLVTQAESTASPVVFQAAAVAVLAAAAAVVLRRRRRRGP